MTTRSAIAIGLALLATACANGLREGVRVMSNGVVFQLHRPVASSIAVVGDFNGWSGTTHPMTRNGDVWRSVVVLPPGDYVFGYLVDGTEWVTPPNATTLVPDGFGGWNGKVTVP